MSSASDSKNSCSADVDIRGVGNCTICDSFVIKEVLETSDDNVVAIVGVLVAYDEFESGFEESCAAWSKFVESLVWESFFVDIDDGVGLVGDSVSGGGDGGGVGIGEEFSRLCFPGSIADVGLDTDIFNEEDSVADVVVSERDDAGEIGGVSAIASVVIEINEDVVGAAAVFDVDNVVFVALVDDIEVETASLGALDEFDTEDFGIPPATASTGFVVDDFVDVDEEVTLPTVEVV